MLKDRQKTLLKKLIETFIKDAKPLASGLLVDKLDEKVSPATVRNEMVALESQGYIFQPHTSAGRIPTEKAYQFYIENYLNGSANLSKKEKQMLEALKTEVSEDREKIKNLARTISALSKQGVMVAFSECDNYAVGLSHLFAQPEFREQDLVVNLSKMIDQMDDKLKDLLNIDSVDPQVFVGDKNPVCKNCSLIVFKYQLGKYKGIIGLIGPMRMDYKRNYALLKESVKLLK